MESYGQRLRRLRLAAGLTQKELAEAADLGNQSAIGNIENQASRSGSAHNARLALALGVSPAYLETGRLEQQSDVLQFIAQGLGKLEEPRRSQVEQTLLQVFKVAVSDQALLKAAPGYAAKQPQKVKT